MDNVSELDMLLSQARGVAEIKKMNIISQLPLFPEWKQIYISGDIILKI